MVRGREKSQRRCSERGSKDLKVRKEGCFQVEPPVQRSCDGYTPGIGLEELGSKQGGLADEDRKTRQKV